MQWVVMDLPKVIDGIIHNFQTNKEIIKIFGDADKINEYIHNRLDKKYYEIVHTSKKVKSTDSPLEAAKEGCKYVLAIESVKKTLIL